MDLKVDGFKRIVANFLMDHIIPIIAREGDNIEERKIWAADVSFAIVSGILVKLGKRYPKDVNEFWEEAQDLLQDLKNNSADYLLDR